MHYEKQINSYGYCDFSDLKEDNLKIENNTTASNTNKTTSKTVHVIKTALGNDQKKWSLFLSLITLSKLSHETITVLKKMYAGLDYAIQKYDLTEADIAFLFEATPDANCEFVKKNTENDTKRDKKISNFYYFIRNKSYENLEENENSLVMYTNNLESLLTAIGYTTVYSDSKSHPFLGPSWIDTKKIAPSQAVIKFIEDIRTSGVRVPPIGSENSAGFPDRWKDDVEKEVKLPDIHQNILHIDNKSELKKYKKIQDLVCFHIPSNKQVLVKKKSIKLSAGLNERYFKLESHPGKIIAKGGFARAHASGSAPLTLAAALFLNQRNDLCEKDKLTNEELIYSFGGILCATYMLGDYHSLAETSMGICYFHQQLENRPIYVEKKEENLDKIHFNNYLNFSLQLIHNIVNKNNRNAVVEIAKKLIPNFYITKNTKQQNNIKECAMQLNSIHSVLEYFISDNFNQLDTNKCNQILKKIDTYKIVPPKNNQLVFDLLDLSIRKIIDTYSETMTKEHKNNSYELYKILQQMRVTIARHLNNDNPVAKIMLPEVLEKGQKLYHAGHIWNIRNILAWGHDRNDYDWYNPKNSDDMLELGGGTYYSTTEPSYVNDESNYVIEATVENEITGASLPQQGDLLNCEPYKTSDTNSNFSLEEIVRGFKTIGKNHNFIRGQQAGNARTELVLLNPEKKIRISKIFKYEGVDHNNQPLLKEVTREQVFRDSYGEDPWTNEKNTFI